MGLASSVLGLPRLNENVPFLNGDAVAAPLINGDIMTSKKRAKTFERDKRKPSQRAEPGASREEVMGQLSPREADLETTLRARDGGRCTDLRTDRIAAQRVVPAAQDRPVGIERYTDFGAMVMGFGFSYHFRIGKRLA